MRRTTRSYRFAAVAIALLSNACYTYGATGLGNAMAPDTRITARLTTRAMVNHESQIGPDVEHVEGRIARTTADSVELHVLRTRNRAGDWTGWSGESVTFARDDFAEARERRFSRGRTILAVGVLAAVTVAAVAVDLFGFGGLLSGSDPRPQPQPNPG